MKKQWILLIICLFLAAGLGSALWALSSYTPQTPSESSTPETVSVTLLQKKASELSKITVTNEADGFTLTFPDGKYVVEGLVGTIPLAQSRVESLRTAMLNIQADTKIGQVESLSDFGLDSPRAKVRADYTDHSFFTLEIGADAPADKGVYCKTGDGTVYVFSSEKVNHFLTGKAGLVDTSVTDSPQTTESGPLIQTALFAGTVREHPVSIERKGDTAAVEAYQIVSPGQGSVGEDVEQTIAGLLGIRAEETAAVSPTPEQMQTLGLSEPYSTVRFSYDESGTQVSCTLIASAPSNGNVYLMRDGRPVVYRLSADSLPWLSMQFGDFVSTRISVPKLEELSGVEVITPQEKLIFAISGEGDAQQVTLNRSVVETERFQSYFQSLAGVPADAYTQEAPASESPLLTLTFTKKDGAASETLRFYQGPSRRVLLQTAEGNSFLVREAYLDTLLTNTEAIRVGGELQSLGG